MPALNGTPYCLPSTLYSPAAPALEVADEARRWLGDVLHEAGVDLIAQAAAAPRLEQVGHVAGLQVGLQRGLERLVLHDGDVDLHVRVLGREGVGHRLPVGLARIVVLDVPPVDRDGLAVRRRPRCRGSRSPCRGVGGAAVSAAPSAESSSLPHAAASTRPSAATSAIPRRRQCVGWIGRVVVISFPLESGVVGWLVSCPTRCGRLVVGPLGNDFNTGATCGRVLVTAQALGAPSSTVGRRAWSAA